MKLGRIGNNADRTDWSGVYSPSDNVEKIRKTDYLENYVWRRNYAFNSPFFHLQLPSITYGDNDYKIYISDGSNTTNAEIRQYNLTTPGDPSTATDSGNSLSFPDGSEFEYLDIAFSSDGTRMYICFWTGSATAYQPPEQYDLSTAWDVSTAVPRVKKFFAGSQENSPFGVYVKSDGTKMYVVGTTGDDINEYDLSTAYDVSTASYNQNFSVSAQETTPSGVEFKPDGTKMYVVGQTGDDVNEYDLSTAWDISTASYNQNFSVMTNPYSVRFKPDGTKMFVTGVFTDDVREYSLSTAWNISTASYVQNVLTGESQQIGLAFSDDGTKMYTCGTTLDYIKEWDLDTAWSLTTVTLNQDSGDLYINPGGLHLVGDNKLYIVGTNYDQVVGYTLNTDKDIRSIDGIIQGDTTLGGGSYDILSGVAINPDGTKFFLLDRDAGDQITEFTLPTPYELDGATRTGNSLSINPNTDESQPIAMHFSYDGKKIYIGGGDATRGIFLYELSTAWDITTATLSKQKLNIYSSHYTTSSNYDTLTQPRYYGSGPIADVEGLAVNKEGTSILIATDDSYTEYKLSC